MLGENRKYSVTQMVQHKGLQPNGGFINPKDLTIEKLDEDNYRYATYLRLVESGYMMMNLPPQIIGMVFDYLLRIELFLAPETDIKELVTDSFRPSIIGAIKADQKDDASAKLANIILNYSKDDRDYYEIVKSAAQLVHYDSVLRAGHYDPDSQKQSPNEEDVSTLLLMLNATQMYLMDNEDIVDFGVGFTANGTSNMLPSDADLISERSIIDIKLTKTQPTAKHTFQLILYYILGLHEYPEIFRHISRLKIINPRLGNAYSYSIDNIDIHILSKIEREIMGYDLNRCIYKEATNESLK